MIKKYNKIVTDIISNFCKRYWKEVYEQEIEYSDYKYSIDILEYQGIALWPINISDDYYALEDILLAEHLKIPCKCVRDYNHREYERHQEGKERDCNLCFYFDNIWDENKREIWTV